MPMPSCFWLNVTPLFRFWISPLSEIVAFHQSWKPPEPSSAPPKTSRGSRHSRGKKGRSTRARQGEIMRSYKVPRGSRLYRWTPKIWDWLSQKDWLENAGNIQKLKIRYTFNEYDIVYIIYILIYHCLNVCLMYI